jgi:tetratricopeptide (TPR) repeat protein
MMGRVMRVVVVLVVHVVLVAWASPLLAVDAAPRAAAPTTAPADVNRLITRLSFADVDVRESAARQLVAMGRTARAKILMAAETSFDPQVRASAQGVLLQLPWTMPDDPPAVAGILANYGQPQVYHRTAAIQGLAANYPRDAGRVLLRLLREDPSDEIRWLIVGTFRHQLGRDKLPPMNQIDVATRRSANLALAGWGWERQDYPKAIELYWRAAELEAERPSVEPEGRPSVDEKGAYADFLFDALVSIELWNKRADRAARALRIQYARRPGSVDRGDEVSNKLDELFALHAGFGPLAGFGDDVRTHVWQLARPQVVYAIGRMYERRAGRPMLADAMYRAAFALNLGGPAGDRSAVSEFLTNQHWNDLAEAELRTIAAAETNPQSIDYANAHLRLGLVLARRGDDEGAGKEKELAMRSLESVGGSVTRVKGERRITGQEAKEQVWAEVHWHYFRAAKAKGDRAEMDARVARLLELLPEDEHVVLDVAPELIEQGRAADAGRLFAKPYAALSQVLKEKPDDPERLNNIAWLCARCGQELEQAERNAERAIGAKPENYAYLDTAAEVKFRLGKVEEAIALEERALALKPGDEFIEGQLRRFRAGRK